MRQYGLPTAVVALYAAGIVAARYAAAAWHVPSLCLFRLTTGVPCPGCGTTRAGLALLGGHVGEALRQNPLTAGLLTAAMLSAVVWRPRLPRRGRALAFAALGVLAAVNWAYLITRSPSRVGTQPPLWAHVRRPR
jgi:hypothetical protein